VAAAFVNERRPSHSSTVSGAHLSVMRVIPSLEARAVAAMVIVGPSLAREGVAKAAAGASAIAASPVAVVTRRGRCTANLLSRNPSLVRKV
jgi:hypothetical protein